MGTYTNKATASASGLERDASVDVDSAESEHLLSLPLKEARECFERGYLAAQVARFGGNISRTASFVGMELSALHRKLKMLGLFDKKRGGDTSGDASEPADSNSDDAETPSAAAG